MHAPKKKDDFGFNFCRPCEVFNGQNSMKFRWKKLNSHFQKNQKLDFFRRQKFDEGFSIMCFVIETSLDTFHLILLHRTPKNYHQQFSLMSSACVFHWTFSCHVCCFYMNCTIQPSTISSAYKTSKKNVFLCNNNSTRFRREIPSKGTSAFNEKCRK